MLTAAGIPWLIENPRKEDATVFNVPEVRQLLPQLGVTATVFGNTTMLSNLNLLMFGKRETIFPQQLHVDHYVVPLGGRQLSISGDSHSSARPPVFSDFSHHAEKLGGEQPPTQKN